MEIFLGEQKKMASEHENQVVLKKLDQGDRQFNSPTASSMQDKNKLNSP